MVLFRCLKLMALAAALRYHLAAGHVLHQDDLGSGSGPQTHHLAKRKHPNLSPDYPLMFQVPLPIPPLKQPSRIVKVPTLTNVTSPISNLTHVNSPTVKQVHYYEIEIKPFQYSIYPNLSPANLVGYDGISPGPTVLVPRGTESVVRFVNNAHANSSVHLHGSYSRAPFDGWAEDTTAPGEYKDYYYPNQQAARMMWYHDHAVHITAENAYMGQAGVYLVHDPAEDALNLPSGYGEYDIPLVLAAKQYNADGTLFSTIGERISLWGDVIHVNGQPWPYLSVEPRKYRFRFLNAAVSRSFALYFVKTSNVGGLNAKLPFKVVASDSGLLEKPVQVSYMYISMAERYEVVFDFSSYAGQTIELRNFAKAGGAGVEDDYEDTDKVMRFVVANTTTEPDTSLIPRQLRTVPFPRPKTRRKINQHFKFHRANGQWLINGVGFAEANNRILSNVPRGTVEIWELENTTDGWSHPIHVHLVDFRVIWRRREGRRVEKYESEGLKDVVWLGREETVLVEAHYAPWDGVYMFHCHNLIHEDDDMMAAFNVTALPDFGYNNLSATFLDPMEPKWRAKPFVMTDFQARTGPFSEEAIDDTVRDFVATDAYGHVDEIREDLEQYWRTANEPVRSTSTRSLSTSAQSSSSTRTQSTTTSRLTNTSRSTMTARSTTIKQQSTQILTTRLQPTTRSLSITKSWPSTASRLTMPARLT
ncbi:putative bilirubin oxidase precursor [Triangularia verruculosa]|uniref:Bilirubin oxidase n=1 Tax=Triangularia verruculosa TaxID=2587418 RepID=A0AAN6XRY4_9PEZI|nr:putative bilirubin oxidase precursor [Triangularia verruculosa]